MVSPPSSNALEQTSHNNSQAVPAASTDSEASSQTHYPKDTFTLYDLRVEVVCPPGARIMCGAKEGDHFTLEGEMMYLPPGQGMSIYSIASVLPLLAAKQRVTAQNDWMTTDAEIACPDPNCPSRLRITRTGLRTFNRWETTVVPLPKPREAI